LCDEIQLPSLQQEFGSILLIVDTFAFFLILMKVFKIELACDTNLSMKCTLSSKYSSSLII